MKLIAFIDGSSMGNPGEAGYGILLKDEDGNILETTGKYIGKATNNVAEYCGLIGCLEIIGKYNAESLTVYSDSQLLVNQINGIYRIKKMHLQKLYNQFSERLASLSLQFRIFHIPREKNSEADGLARKAVLSRSIID